MYGHGGYRCMSSFIFPCDYLLHSELTSIGFGLHVKTWVTVNSNLFMRHKERRILSNQATTALRMLKLRSIAAAASCGLRARTWALVF